MVYRKDLVVADDVLIAILSICKRRGFDGFDRNGLHQWFDDHKNEMPLSLHSLPGPLPFFRDIDQAITNLSGSNLIGWWSGKDHCYHIGASMPKNLKKNLRNLLEQKGLTREKLESLADSFAQTLCSKAG